MTAHRLDSRLVLVAVCMIVAAGFAAWVLTAGPGFAAAAIHFLMSGTGAAMLVMSLAAFVLYRRIKDRQIAEKRFQALLAAISDAVVITRKDGRIVRVNAQAEKLFGYSAKELLNRSVETLLQPQAADAGISRFLRDGTITTTQGEVGQGPGYVGRRKDGTEVAVEVNFGSLRDKQEFLLIHVIRDVTEQKRKERRQAVRHAVRRILLESATFPEAAPALVRALCEGLGWDFGIFWLVDPATKRPSPVASWQVPDINVSELEALSRERASSAGGGCPRRVGKGDDLSWVLDMDKNGSVRGPVASRAGLRQALAVPILCGKTVLGTIELFRREFGPREEHLTETMNIIGSQIGNYLERKRTEEALRRTEEQFRHAQKLEAIGRLAAGVAHDFNNLLTIIQGCTAFLAQGIPTDSPLRTHVVGLADATKRAAGIARQLLAFGRKQKLQPQVLDLNSVIGGAEEMLRRLLGAGVTLSLELTPQPCLVKADAGQVEQVILNLAINAHDAMPHGGSLSISTTHVEVGALSGCPHPDLPPGSYLLLTVSDTGCGMDEATRSRIFEPFFTTKEVGKGTGLGLATAYGIVKQSGGHLEVETASGRGATFKIYLPRAEEAAPATPSSPGTAETCQPVRV